MNRWHFQIRQLSRDLDSFWEHDFDSARLPRDLQFRPLAEIVAELKTAQPHSLDELLDSSSKADLLASELRHALTNDAGTPHDPKLGVIIASADRLAGQIRRLLTPPRLAK